MTADDERERHKQKMFEGLEASIAMMPVTKEVGALFLLDTGLRALCVMRDDGDVGRVEAEVLKARLVAAFEYAHPGVSGQLQDELSILNLALSQVLSTSPSDSEVVQIARAALRDFQKRGLETIQ